MSDKKFSFGDIRRKLNEEKANASSESSEDQKNSPSPNQVTSPSYQYKSPPAPGLPDQPVFGQKAAHIEKTVQPRHQKIDMEPPPIRAASVPEKPVKQSNPVQEPEIRQPESSGANRASEDEEREEEFDFYRYLGIILRRKNIILAVTLLMTLFSLFRYLSSEKFYVSNARLLFRPDDQEIINDTRSYRHWGDREKQFNTHLELLKSNTVMKMVCENLGDKITPLSISSGLRINQGETNGEKNDIIELTFKHTDPQVSRDVLNELCRSYIDYRRNVNTQEITRLIYKFETQITKLQAELDIKEGDLRQFKEENRMIQLTSETDLLVSKLSDMELALQKSQMELIESKERLIALQSQIGKQELEIVQSITYQDPFQSRLADLELQFNEASAGNSQEHPKVRTLRQQIESIKSAAVDSISREAASKTLVTNPIRQSLLHELINLTIEKAAIETKRIAQEKIIERLNQEMFKLPSMEQKYAYLQRQTESQLQTLRVLRSKYEEAKIRRDSQESDLKILELAETPQIAASNLKLTSIIIGLLVGLILGIAVAFLFEYLDQSLKDPSEVERTLEIPLLGIVPLIEADKALVDESDLSKNILEPFRALRANLKHIAAAHNLKTFIVCSAVKGEGKTTLAANLAITFALDGKKVILIDADLRRSQMHSLFGIPKQIGFSDYLLSKSTLDGIIKPTPYENLSVITSGERPQNPAELLGTVKFDMMLEEIRDKAEIIIFDSPALLPVSDTITMAPKMDGCVIVVRTFWTPLNAARQAKNQLKRVGCRIFGGILNGVSHSRGFYPYYYGYYGYYSYKYTYEEDRPDEKFSFRKLGLGIENKIKEKLGSAFFSIPKNLTAIALFSRKLARKKTFWILLILFLSASGIHIWLRSYRVLPSDSIIQYIGIGGSKPSSSDTDNSNNFNDMARPSTGLTENMQSSYSEQNIQDSISMWLNALSERNLERFFSFYDKISFRYPGGNFYQWKEKTTKELDKTDRRFIPGRITENRKGKSFRELSIEVFGISQNDTLRFDLATIWQRGAEGWRITREKKVNK